MTSKQDNTEAGKPFKSLEASQALAAVRHLGDLPAAAQRDLIACMQRRAFAPGQVIFLEGEPAEALYILAQGWVKATRLSPEGREQAMLFLRPGEIFGDIAVYTGTPYPGTVVAMEPVVAWSIAAADFERLLAVHPELARAALRRAGERVLYYISLVEDLSLRSVEARLARTLLLHAEPAEGGLAVPRRAWTTFDEMAARLGTVRDVLSRALHTLEAEGLLRVERNRIVILDPQGMAGRGEG